MSKISNERFNEILREEIARERKELQELNELFGAGSFLGGLGDSIMSGDNFIGGAIKQKIADSILKSMGVSDPGARLLFSEIIEQLSLEEMKEIWKGGPEACPMATNIIFMALCEILGRKIHDKILSASSEIPVIGVFSSWLGGGGLLNRAAGALTAEIISDQLSSQDTQIGGWMHSNVKPPLEEKLCAVIADFQSKSMVDIALGRDGSAGATAELGGADSAPVPNIDADASTFETPLS